jgi:hypothetical protein
LNIQNKKKDCQQDWDGAEQKLAARTAPGYLMKNNFTGQATWDVTQDIRNGATYGWAVKKREEEKSGNVRFYSREGAAGMPNFIPQLVLEFDN